MDCKDIRWKQRLGNYRKALAAMRNAVDLAAARELSDPEKQGMIRGLEFTFELAWNVMKDYLKDQGIQDITGSRDAIRQAFRNGLIADGQVWMDMVTGRNLASHTYDEETANGLVTAIVGTYYPRFSIFAEKMDTLE
uniref:Nucleotidyltransferase n=1 Tax=uncultured bacterium contig00088 TaxID=1181561 RepID=A0A806K215_9BACT|nr:nucleotidyltransferase [uncultured bacterium contig00088]